MPDERREIHVALAGNPNCGKTTVFQTLTQSESPGTRSSGQVETRIVPVPDTRLNTLTGMFTPRKVTPATIEFVRNQRRANWRSRPRAF